MDTFTISYLELEKVRSHAEYRILEDSLIDADEWYHTYQIVFRGPEDLGQEYAWKVIYYLHCTEKVSTLTTYTATKVYPKQVTVTVWE